MATIEIQGDGQAFLIFIGGVILIFALFWLLAWGLSKIPGVQKGSRRKTRPYSEYDLMNDLYYLGKSI